jgi:phenylacetate-CoA ligase
MNESISVIAPFFNEEEIIGYTIDELDNLLAKNFNDYEIVLVDDGSTDKSQEIVKTKLENSNHLTLIIKNENTGIWAAWEEGVRKAKYDCICIIDSDLQYQPADIINLYKKHIQGFQFVQGIRAYSSDVNIVRKIISKSFSLVLKLFFRKNLLGLKDVKSGFFVTRKSLLINIFDFFPKFTFGQSFIIVYANFLNAFVEQTPVLFSQRFGGKSFLKTLPLKTIFTVLKEIASLKFFLNKKDFYLIYLNYFCNNIKKNNEFSFYENLRLNIFFKTHFFHKWKIGKNLKSYVDAQLLFQKLSKKQIVEYQTRRLIDLVWYYYQNSSLYRDNMVKLNIHPYDIQNLNDLKLLPYLEKDQLKLNFSNGLLSNKTKNYKTLLISTSGSTGMPLSLIANSEQLKVRWANTFRAWTWTGWTPSKRQARLWHQTLGMSKIQVIKEFIDNIFFKRIFIPAYTINDKNIKKYLDKLIKHKPYLIDGYAESFNFIMNYIRVNNVKNFKLNSIISSAQEMPNNLKTEIENKFSAKIFDKYGAREFSGIAYEALGHKGKLICEDSYIVELLKNNEIIDHNDIGEIFITDLNNFITPMIRYRIGDLGTKINSSEEINNKIKFNTLGNIEGRTKAIIICYNNTWVPGTFFAHFFKEYTQLILRYQVIQNSIGEINLKLVKNKNTEESEIREMIKELRKTVGEIDINIQYVPEISMIKTGKTMGAISNLDNKLIEQAIHKTR